MTSRFYIFIISLIILISTPLRLHAAPPIPTRWHNEFRDTTRIDSILRTIHQSPSLSPQQYVARIAPMFLGTPYGAGTLEYSPEQVTVNLDSLDCTTFVEVISALALTAAEQRDSWQDFIYNLASLRYRSSTVDGYASRLHYFSDWILDNNHRGNIVDVTDRMPDQPAYQVKTLDFMTRNRNLYPALTDDKEFDRLKTVEIGYRNHRFPYIKTASFYRKNVAESLREGDIVALVTNKNGLDISHVGFITLVNGIPHLLHASSRHGKVIIDPLPLTEYLKKSRSTLGLRILRLKSR